MIVLKLPVASRICAATFMVADVLFWGVKGVKQLLNMKNKSRVLQFTMTVSLLFCAHVTGSAQTGRLSITVQEMFTGAPIPSNVTVHRGDEDYSGAFENWLFRHFSG